MTDPTARCARLMANPRSASNVRTWRTVSDTVESSTPKSRGQRLAWRAQAQPARVHGTRSRKVRVSGRPAPGQRRRSRPPRRRRSRPSTWRRTVRRARRRAGSSWLHEIPVKTDWDSATRAFLNDKVNVQPAKCACSYNSAALQHPHRARRNVASAWHRSHGQRTPHWTCFDAGMSGSDAVRGLPTTDEPGRLRRQDRASYSGRCRQTACAGSVARRSGAGLASTVEPTASTVTPVASSTMATRTASG
jgi:hypothetical protein